MGFPKHLKLFYSFEISACFYLLRGPWLDLAWGWPGGGCAWVSLPSLAFRSWEPTCLFSIDPGLSRVASLGCCEQHQGGTALALEGGRIVLGKQIGTTQHEIMH